MSSWTKKDRAACIIIFSMAIVLTITFVSSITLSYLFDTHSVSGAITAGQVLFTIGGGPNSDGKIKFAEVLSPNTTYTGTDYTLTITNKSTSGDIYLYVYVEASDIIKPVPKSNLWLGGDTNDTKGYFFYKGKVTQNTTLTFCDAFRTLDFGNPDAGQSVTLKVTVGAVQAQAGACKALIQGGVEGWANAPSAFKTFVGA